MTFRFKKSQSVYVTSKYKINPSDSNSNFTYEIKLDDDKYDHFCITSISIPKSFYMVSSPNNFFYLREDGVDYKITLQEGNYSLSSLKIELENLLNEATVSLNTYVLSIPGINEVQTGKITFSVSGNTSQPSFVFQADNDIAEILGFINGNIYTFSSNLLVSPNVVYLQRNESLLLCSDLIKSTSNSSYSTQVIQQIFGNNDADYSFINWSCPDIFGYSKALNHHSTSYRFLLTNFEGDLINLNGAHISFTILFYQYNDSLDLIKQSTILSEYEKLTTLKL